MKYYIMDENSNYGLREISYNEYTAYNSYINQVSQQLLNINDVPEEYRELTYSLTVGSIQEKAKAYDILMGNEV